MVEVSPRAGASIPGTFSGVVVDRDGTLLNSSGALSAKTLAAVRDLSNKGVLFAIATGRPVPSLQPHIDAIGLEVPCITFNGAAVCSLRPNAPPHLIWQRPLGAAAVSSAISATELLGLCLSYVMADCTVCRCHGHEQRRLLDKFEHLEGVKQRVVTSSAELEGLPGPLKLVVLTRTPDATAATLRAHLGSSAHVISAEMHAEILRPGVHKGNALSHLCKHCGAVPSEVVAFGDGMNDIELLRTAGLGCAMLHARDEVRQASEIVTDWNNDDDGVVRQIEAMYSSGRIIARCVAR